MKKVYLMMSVFASLVVLSGCKDKTTPQRKEVIQAFEALKNGKFAEFRAHLMGRALEKFKSDAAADQLRQQTAGYTNIKLSDVIVGTSAIAGGGTLTQYRVTAKIGRQEVAHVFVNCGQYTQATTRTVCHDDVIVPDDDNNYVPNPPRYEPPAYNPPSEPNPPRYEPPTYNPPSEPNPPRYEPPTYNPPSEPNPPRYEPPKQDDYIRPDDTPRTEPKPPPEPSPDRPPRFGYAALVSMRSQSQTCYEEVVQTPAVFNCKVVDLVLNP